MNAQSFREIAAEYSMVWPALFLQLADDRMLDWGAFGHDWAKTQASSVRERVPLLFFDWDFEPLTPEMVREELIEMRDPDDYRHIDPAEGFLPFGRTPGGDLYCFHRRARQGGRVPVVLIAHNYTMGERLAPDLQSFIVGEMVANVAEFDADQFLGEGDPQANAQDWLRTHRPYLADEQAEALSELFRRPVTRLDGGRQSLIDAREAEALIQRIAPSPARGTEFLAWGDEGRIEP